MMTRASRKNHSSNSSSRCSGGGGGASEHAQQNVMHQPVLPQQSVVRHQTVVPFMTTGSSEIISGSCETAYEFVLPLCSV